MALSEEFGWSDEVRALPYPLYRRAAVGLAHSGIVAGAAGRRAQMWDAWPSMISPSASEAAPTTVGRLHYGSEQSHLERIAKTGFVFDEKLSQLLSLAISVSPTLTSETVA